MTLYSFLFFSKNFLEDYLGCGLLPTGSHRDHNYKQFCNGDLAFVNPAIF